MSSSHRRYLDVRRFHRLSRISAFMTQSIILMAAVVYIVGVLAQFLWEAQAHKVSGR